MNNVFRILNNNKRLADRIKMIGIGASDDIYGVDYFKKTFKVEFPLFTDEDRVIHKMVGEPGTPYFIVVKSDNKGDEEIILTHPGRISGAIEFISAIQKKAGIK